MKLSTKFLAALSGFGLLYSFSELVNGEGGGGLEDFIDALGYASILLFVVSLAVIVFNFKHLKNHGDTFLFLLFALPMTVLVTENAVQNIHYNRTPDFIPKYARPVNLNSFIVDSLRIIVQIDSLIASKNRNTGGVKVANTFIDTIVYSQTGEKIFVSYIQKFEKNDLGNDLDPAFLYGDNKEYGYWDLEQAKYNFSGSYHDILSLKKAVRRFYFNQFTFLDKDSTKKNFFWRKIMHPGD